MERGGHRYYAGLSLLLSQQDSVDGCTTNRLSNRRDLLQCISLGCRSAKILSRSSRLDKGREGGNVPDAYKSDLCPNRSGSLDISMIEGNVQRRRLKARRGLPRWSKRLANLFHSATTMVSQEAVLKRRLAQAAGNLLQLRHPLNSLLFRNLGLRTKKLCSRATWK